MISQSFYWVHNPHQSYGATFPKKALPFWPVQWQGRDALHFDGTIDAKGFTFSPGSQNAM